MKKIYTKASHLFLTVLLAVVIVGCGSDGGSSAAGDNRVEWRTASTVGAAAGSATLEISGSVGTAWSATIDADAAWCSFDYRDTSVKSAEGTVQEASIRNLLYVYFTANDSSEQRHATITFTFAGEEPRELTLMQLTSSESNDPYEEGHFEAWAELPVKVNDDDYIYVSHFAPLASGTTARNFSFCFDRTLHVAHWVAYPLHQVYRGSASRTDDFGYDPKVPEAYQANLSRSYAGSYDRGHQLPSADRLATYLMNEQTFYATNMTPQLGSLNRYMWANLETLVRNNMCADTLYVVTGCYYANTSVTTTDVDGMICPVPTNYFKVLLRTVSGNSGKRVQDCTASELKSIGFWVNQSNYGNIQPPASICRTVAEIEQLTGFTFFPSVPDQAKQQNTPSSWGM